MARKNNGFGETEAARHPIERIDIYEVTKEEVEMLARSSTSDLYLEFAIASISIFGSFLCSLLVADFSESPKASNFYLIVTVLTAIATLCFGCLWVRFRKSKENIKDRILSRPYKEN